MNVTVERWKYGGTWKKNGLFEDVSVCQCINDKELESKQMLKRNLLKEKLWRKYIMKNMT